MNTLFDNQVETIETEKIGKNPLNTVKEGTYDLEHAYDLDIAQDIIFSLQVLKDKERDKETDPQKRDALQQEIDMLLYESQAIYKGGEMQSSLIHKALTFYAPIVKAHYLQYAAF
jgi:hypothetical protein